MRVSTALRPAPRHCRDGRLTLSVAVAKVPAPPTLAGQGGTRPGISASGTPLGTDRVADAGDSRGDAAATFFRPSERKEERNGCAGGGVGAVSKLAQPRRQRVAVDRGDVRRSDERPGPRRALRRRDAEALVGEQHDAVVLRVRARADRRGCCGRSTWASGRRGTASRATGSSATSSASPGAVLSHTAEQGQAAIPLVTTGPPFHFPSATLVYFQFVFAAITPILMLGSVLGRVNFKAWLVFVPLWTTFVYTINAFLIWGGGFWAQKGTVDYSGGYVIHLSAGISGFVAAAVIGPRLARDREIDAPNNLLMVAAGRGPALARLERLQRRRPVLRRRRRRSRGAEHQPRHGRRVPGLGRLGLPDRPQAVADRQRQRHDRRPRRDHARRRLRERLRRDGDRRRRVVDRLPRLQLPEPRSGRSGTSTTPSASSTRTASPGSPADCSTGLLADSNMTVYLGLGQHAELRRDGQPAPVQAAAVRRALGDRVLRDRDARPAEAGRARDPAPDERAGHGDGRHRRARPRGVSRPTSRRSATHGAPPTRPVLPTPEPAGG